MGYILLFLFVSSLIFFPLFSFIQLYERLLQKYDLNAVDWIEFLWYLILPHHHMRDFTYEPIIKTLRAFKFSKRIRNGKSNRCTYILCTYAYINSFWLAFVDSFDPILFMVVSGGSLNKFHVNLWQCTADNVTYYCFSCLWIRIGRTNEQKRDAQFRIYRIDKNNSNNNKTDNIEDDDDDDEAPKKGMSF